YPSPRFLSPYAHSPVQPSLPTRRSSDLPVHGQRDVATSVGRELDAHNGQAIVEREDGAAVASPRRFVRVSRAAAQLEVPSELTGDRKSTRLNSSHQIISYAVFCLKKKKK